MNEAQTKAWSCLREDEKQSLFLQMANGKSAWEAGTIMKRSHYKYLEIRDRAQKFFKMFTDFFSIYPAIWRPNAPYASSFKDYIEGCIEKRLSKDQSNRYTGDATNTLRDVSTRRLETNLGKLRISEDPWDQATFTLIVEFDRWNNFRILPRTYQAPSAYKRRVNGKHKNYIRYLRLKFPEWAHQKLIERYRCSSKCKSTYWVALISRQLYKIDGYYLFPVKQSEEVVKEFSRFFIYLFNTKDEADSFGHLINTYITKTSSIRLGQHFWKEYRDIIESAVNYTKVNYIDFNMTVLDQAYTPLKKKGSKSTTTKSQDIGQKRASPDFFYQ